MRIINIDGHNIGVHDERLDGAITLRLIQKSRTNGTYALDLLDRLIDGGADVIFKILDPVEGDPSVEKEVTPFVEKLFEKMAEQNDVKNSLGSQASSQPVSPPLGPIYNGTSE